MFFYVHIIYFLYKVPSKEEISGLWLLLEYKILWWGRNLFFSINKIANISFFLIESYIFANHKGIQIMLHLKIYKTGISEFFAFARSQNGDTYTPDLKTNRIFSRTRCKIEHITINQLIELCIGKQILETWWKLCL